MMNTPANAHRRGFDPKEIEGRTVDAKYDVHELIDTGGMGAIYRALDTEMGRVVALKAIVAPRSAMSEMDIERVQRFKRECKGLAQMEH
jgi:serine/threonine protein kinase